MLQCYSFAGIARLCDIAHTAGDRKVAGRDAGPPAGARTITGLRNRVEADRAGTLERSSEPSGAGIFASGTRAGAARASHGACAKVDILPMSTAGP